jgi:hypothetical protein
MAERTRKQTLHRKDKNEKHQSKYNTKNGSLYLDGVSETSSIKYMMSNMIFIQDDVRVVAQWVPLLE